jgi:hypothetical protein
MKQLKLLAATLALMITFGAALTGCGNPGSEPEGPDGPDNSGGGDESGYYDPEDDALSVAVRNVRMKYSYQYPTMDDNSIVNAEAMTCQGRGYVKGAKWAYEFKRNGYDSHWFVQCSPSPEMFTAYSFDDNEWFTMNYYSEGMTPNISKSGGGLGIAPRQVEAVEQYYREDRTENYWDEPYVDQSPNHTWTRWREIEEQRTIAGVVCEGYSVHEKHEFADALKNQEFILWYVWYDPETNVTMRYEEYRVPDPMLAFDNMLTYWFQIDEIEYGTVTVSEMDAILDSYLATNSPIDISDDEEAGVNW